MSFPRSIKDLCPPALFYFSISIIGLLLIAFQNFSNEHVYALGNYSCAVTSTTIVMVFKLVYVLFWTWVLNLMCKDGHPGISWLLVLFPFILMFVIIGAFMISSA